MLQNTVSVNISMALRNAAQAMGGIALLFYTSPVLTGLMLAIVPVVAVGAVTYGRKVRGLSKQTQDALAVANEVAEESLSGIRTVRSFAAERHEVARYASATERAYEIARHRARQSSFFLAGASSAGYLASAVVLWYGGRLVLDGKMTVGNLTSFLIYSLMVAIALGALADLWADFMRASGAAERVFELIDRKPAIPASGGERLPSVQGRVDFQEVRFAYPTRQDVPVLQGIDLQLAPGEVVAIVGPSGAGKSTIAGLLARMYDPQGGRVLLDGKPLTRARPRVAAAADWHGGAGADALRRLHRGQHPLRPHGRHATPRWRPPRAPPTRTSSSPASPRATAPWWASAACSSPAARSSASPSPGPCSRTRACWCWTRPPARSTRRASTWCRRPWSG